MNYHALKSMRLFRRLPAVEATRAMDLLIILTAAIIVVGCSTIPGGMIVQISVNKGETITLHDMSDQTGWGSGTHIFLARVSDEITAMTYWVAGDGSVQGTSNMDWPTYSDDRGMNWKHGNPFQWNAPNSSLSPDIVKKGEDFTNFSLGPFFSLARFPDGTRVLFSTGGYLVKLDLFSRIVSQDGGKSWSPPEIVNIEWPGSTTQRPYHLFFEHEAVVDENNTMFTVAYGAMVAGEKLQVFLFESTDHGKTLKYKSTVATGKDAPWGGDGPCEPSLLMVSSNKLLCIMRTGIASGTSTDGRSVAGSLLMSWSDDLGITWKHKRMNIPGVMPKLRRLSNGLIVLATGRPGNSVYISSDEGRSFGREITITAPHIRTTGYCDVVEVSPDKILVVYDIINSPLQKLWLWEPTMGNGIFGTFYTIKYRLGGKG